MKYNLVPITKILATMAFSVWAIIFSTPLPLVLLWVVELFILALVGQFVKQLKPLMALIGFGIVLGLIQYVAVWEVNSALVTALRMLCMTTVFIWLLSTTKLQDLTAALVKQCKIPSEYAFMFTAALRFVPDFIRESKAVREAQACRGMDMKGSLGKRLRSYTTVVQPLVLKSLGKSETMALSLELRGFGSKRRRFASNVSMGQWDYLLTALMAFVTVLIIYVRISM